MKNPKTIRGDTQLAGKKQQKARIKNSPKKKKKSVEAHIRDRKSRGEGGEGKNYTLISEK